MFETFELFTVLIELDNDGVKSTKQITSPALFIMSEFSGLIEQVARSNSPVSISISRTEPIYDQFERKETTNEYKITFKNNAYIAKYGE
jgi:hypothetical protein